MSSFEWNKVIASVLTAMIVAMVAGILASQIVRPHRLHEAVYLPPGAEGGARQPPQRAPAAAPLEPIEPLLAKADVEHGQQLSKVCPQCHTFDKGGANKIGPNLYGVMAENIAAVPDYQFSPALAGEQETRSGTPDKLNVWLHRPQEFAKGTKMSFPGLPKAQDRADVVAYLESLK